MELRNRAGCPLSNMRGTGFGTLHVPHLTQVHESLRSKTRTRYKTRFVVCELAKAVFLHITFPLQHGLLIKSTCKKKKVDFVKTGFSLTKSQLTDGKDSKTF